MIKKILQGMLVGIGAILPGVSGGMIAAAFNIYSLLIEALNKVTQKPIKAILSVWEYLVGVIIGVLVGFLIIAYVFYLIPVPATLLFIGLILGGLPEIYKLSENRQKKYTPIIIVSITFLLMMSLTVFAPYLARPDASQTNSVLWFIVGALLASSLIIPGLSGSMLMLIIGYFGPLILLGKNIIESILTINVDLFAANIFQIGFLALGVIVTILMLGKVFHLILKKYPKTFYQVILGIIIAAPINILFSLNEDLLGQATPVNIFDWSSQWFMWMIGILCIPLGIYLARLFSKDITNETEKS